MKQSSSHSHGRRLRISIELNVVHHRQTGPQTQSVPRDSPDQVRFGTKSYSKDTVQRGQLAVWRRQEAELLEEVGHVEEQLHGGQGLAQTLTSAWRQYQSGQYYLYMAWRQYQSGQYYLYTAWGQYQSGQYYLYTAWGQHQSGQYYLYMAWGQYQSGQYYLYTDWGQYQSGQYYLYIAWGQYQSGQYYLYMAW